MGNPPALLFGLGDRVIHTKTSGRIRGKVVELRIRVDRTEATIVVDGLNREHTYDAGNLALEPESLDCDHCGDAAIEEDVLGLFYDGDGERCMTCGFPGSVVIYDNIGVGDEGPAWRCSEKPGDVCTDASCKDCAADRPPHATNTKKGEGQ